MEIVTFEKPEAIQVINQTSYYYNYNIKEEDSVDLDGNPIKIYRFDSIALKGIVSPSTILDAVLKTIISKEDELKLINNFNKYQLGLSKLPQDYIDYINKRDSLKQQIEKDYGSYSRS